MQTQARDKSQKVIPFPRAFVDSRPRKVWHPESWTRYEIFFLVLAILAGAFVRLDFLVANKFIIDSDEAIVGLMAQHVLQGAEIPVFYYGQHYMGSLEPLLTSGIFAIAGISSLSLKLVPFFFSLILLGLVYGLARELGGRLAAQCAVLLTAIPPSALVIWSAMSRGGFIEIVVLGTLCLLLTVRWLKRDEPEYVQTGFIAVLLGLGWWVNNQIVYSIVPIGMCMAIALRSRPALLLKHLTLSIPLFILGGLPFWIYNIQHSFISFEMFKAAGGGDALSHIYGLFAIALPILLGAKHFWQTNDIFLGSTLIVWFLHGTLLAGLLYWRLPHIKQMLRGTLDRERPIELLFCFVLCSLLIFSLSSFGYLVQAPRYLLPLYGAFFVLSGISLSLFFERFGATALLPLPLLLGVHVASSYYPVRALPGEPFVTNGERVSKDQSELITWLSENKINKIQTNYWIGYRLAFETQERITFALFSEPEQVRIPAYEENIKTRLFLPFVLVPSQAELVRAGLSEMGLYFSEIRLSGYVVLFDIHPSQHDLKEVAGSEFHAHSPYGEKGVSNVVDGSLATRWGSAHPQVPGMELVLSLTPPRRIRALKYDLGQWKHDYARGLEIFVEDSKGVKHQILDQDGYRALRYVLSGDGDFELVFGPVEASKIIITQTGEHPILDWSIAELKFYE